MAAATQTAAREGRSLTAILGAFLPAAAVCSVFVVVGVVHVTSRVLVVRAGYELSKLDEQRRSLEQEHSKLALERATLRSPARLERIGREQFDMAPAGPGRVLYP